MSDSRIDRLADDFFRAFDLRRWPTDHPPDFTGLSIEDAYEVQDRVAELRVARGEVVVGYKVGCTSNAIRNQFGLTEPIYGRLFSQHTRESAGPLDRSQFANCAIEPEMVIETSRELSGEDLSDEELIAAIRSVRPGIELHHFTFYQTPPTTQELICSGGIHAGTIIGADAASPQELSFREEQFTVLIDDEVATRGAASEIMGGPLHSLRWLVGKLSRVGRALPAGSLVIPGSPTELLPIDRPLDLTVRIDRVGEVTQQFCD